MPKHWCKLAVGLGFVVAAAALAANAQATVHLTKAELNGTQLRLEGTAVPNATITVDGVALGTSDGNGNFKIQKDPHTPPADCIVQVNDGSSFATPAFLAGCTQVTTVAPGATGSVSILPGGGGSGTITSQPSGINCRIVNGNGDPTTTCNAVFPAGTVVKLDARPDQNTSFVGWRGVGCSTGEPTIAANVDTTCQVGFLVKF